MVSLFLVNKIFCSVEDISDSLKRFALLLCCLTTMIIEFRWTDPDLLPDRPLSFRTDTNNQHSALVCDLSIWQEFVYKHGTSIRLCSSLFICFVFVCVCFAFLSSLLLFFSTEKVVLIQWNLHNNNIVTMSPWCRKKHVICQRNRSYIYISLKETQDKLHIQTIEVQLYIWMAFYSVGVLDEWDAKLTNKEK